MRFSKKYERPRWVDKSNEPLRTWVLFDSSTDRLRTGRAETQKEAIKIALSRNIVPQDTHDVVPRFGGYRDKLMSPKEFEEFMDKLRN